jgi:hypothetical protein
MLDNGLVFAHPTQARDSSSLSGEKISDLAGSLDQDMFNFIYSVFHTSRLPWEITNFLFVSAYRVPTSATLHADSYKYLCAVSPSKSTVK